MLAPLQIQLIIAPNITSFTQLNLLLKAPWVDQCILWGTIDYALWVLD